LEKKRILVVTSDVTFVEGGHLTIAKHTVQALRQQGYDADLVLTPQNRFGRQFRAYLANRFTEAGRARPPSTVIPLLPELRRPPPCPRLLAQPPPGRIHDLWPMLRPGSAGRADQEGVRRFSSTASTRISSSERTSVYAQLANIQACPKAGGIPPRSFIRPAPAPPDGPTRACLPSPGSRRSSGLDRSRRSAFKNGDTQGSSSARAPSASPPPHL
jgi:hypothetical protein